MIVSEALMETSGIRDEFTFIVIAFEVAVVGETQDAVEVITQVTISLSARPALVYVELLVPTLA